MPTLTLGKKNNTDQVRRCIARLRTRCIDCHTSVPEKRHCASIYIFIYIEREMLGLVCVFPPLHPNTPHPEALCGNRERLGRGARGGTSWSPCICEKGGVYTSGAPSFPGPSKSRRRGQGGWLEEGLSYRCGTRREGDPRQAEWSRQCAHSGKRGAALPERDGEKKKKITTFNRREVANRRDSLRQRPDEDAQERASRPER